MKNNCNNSCAEYELWLGLLAFVVGGVFLLELFDIISPIVWDYIWPSLLVVSGLKLIVTGGLHSKCCTHGCGNCDTVVMEEKPVKKAAPKKKKTSKKKS